MSVRSSGVERRRHIEELIQRLSETDEALQALGAGEVDAVVDPASAAPILLSRAQKALAESEARYRELVSRCPALVCEITPEGVTTFVNDAIRTLLDYEPEELLGKPWWERLVPREHVGQARKLASLVLRGDVTGFELPLRTAAGDRRWILW